MQINTYTSLLLSALSHADVDDFLKKLNSFVVQSALLRNTSCESVGQWVSDHEVNENTDYSFNQPNSNGVSKIIMNCICIEWYLQTSFLQGLRGLFLCAVSTLEISSRCCEGMIMLFDSENQRNYKLIYNIVKSISICNSPVLN